MQVAIILQLQAALELHRLTSRVEVVEGSIEVKELLHAAEVLGIRLEPMHPGQPHPLLAPYFTIEVPNRETADRVVKQLGQIKVVEAAYLKPAAELP